MISMSTFHVLILVIQEVAESLLEKFSSYKLFFIKSVRTSSSARKMIDHARDCKLRLAEEIVARYHMDR